MAKGGGSQSYFSSGLGFGGDDSFREFAGFSSTTGSRPSVSSKNDTNLSTGAGASAGQNKDAGSGGASFATRATQPAAGGFRHGRLNSRFAVKGSGAKGGLGAFESSQSDDLGRDATGSSSGKVDEHQNRVSFQREERRSGESGAKPGGPHQGKPVPAAGRDGGVRGSGVQKADVPDSNLQSKRAAAAAAAFNVPWRGNPGAVKAASNVGSGGTNLKAAANVRFAAAAPGQGGKAPAVSQPGGFRANMVGERAGGAAASGGPTTLRESFGDQAVPTRGKSQSKGSSGSGSAFGGGLAAPGQRAPSKDPQEGEARSRSLSSAQYDGLDSIRANYGDGLGFKGAGKRTEAAGISSFLDLNSPPPADATFFDAFADAASGLGDTTWAASPTVEERRGRSAESKGSTGPGQTQGFSLFADEPFGFPGPANGPTSAQGLGEAQEPVVDRRRPFATMYRKQQAEGLAHGFDKLHLSKPTAPPVSPSKPQNSTRAAEKPAPKPQPGKESASLFHVAPEVLFGGKAPFAFGSSLPPERAVGAKHQEPSKAAERDAFVVFGAQSAEAPSAQNPFVFQTPPQAPSNQTAAPSFGSRLPSPSFVQSPPADPEKAKPAPPQGINAFVFSAGSSGSSASGGPDQPESLGKKIGEADSSHFSQSFAERLHLAGAKSADGVKSQGAPAGAASSLEGLRGFQFKGSVPDEDTISESFGAGVFGKGQPVFAARDSSPEVGGSPQVLPFVAFGGGGVSPGTPAKRRSEQKMAKKASPSGKTAFAATRSLQRTPVGKPPIPVSPKPAFAASGVVESGSAKPGAGGVATGPSEAEQEARVESPQPMDISPGRESFENGDVHGTGPVKRVDASVAAAEKVDKGRDEQGAGPVDAKGFRAAVNNRYAAAGSGKSRAGAKGAQKAGVNGLRVSASYDGDLEEGSSSFEESEGDKRTAKTGTAWTGRWTPPKEPYEYDSSESDSQSDDDVNPEAQDKDWVRGEKEKLERLKKTAREVGKDGAGAVENESESATGATEGVEALGADVEEMDLGSVDRKELTESSESDAEDEAESVAKAPNGGESSSAQPAEGVSGRVVEPVRGLGGFKEGERGGSAEPELNEPIKPEEVPPAKTKTDAAPKIPAGSFVFGAGKSTEGAFAFQAQSPGSPPRPPPVAGPFVFASGPTSPKSPRRSSLSRRSMERSDSLRRSTESGRRRSLERVKASRQSAEKTVPRVSGQGFASGAPKGAGKFPEPPGWSASDAAKSSALPEWTFAGSQFPGSPNPTFPASPNPTFSPSPNPTFPPSPNPTFPASPKPPFPASPNAMFGNPFFGGPDYADHSKPAFPDSSNRFPGATVPPPAATTAVQVQSPKLVRKARRVGPSRARASWDKLHSSSLSGGASSYIDLTADDVASPEAMDEENGNGKRQEVQGPGGRKPSRNQVYYPESSESYFQYFDPSSGAPVEGGAPTAESGLDDLPPDVVSFSTAQATEAASTCERWRLKGNQAYASKDYKGAEALYTKGVDAVTTGDGLLYDTCAKSAALCLSNRAAVRMALGRVREALSDCLTACAVDPEFEKVRLRAANCHLMLGEFDAARAWYAECSKAGNPGGGGVSIKVWAEACESLKRTEEVQAAVTKAAELLDCQDLLTSVTQSDAETVPTPAATSLSARPFRQVSASRASEALKLVSATLVVAGHSEALHELRALALLWLRKFDDVIEFSESSLAASELNHARGEGADGEEEDLDGVRTGLESVRTWRWRVSALAQYHLGKLEEADELAGKVEAVTVGEKGEGRVAASEETLAGLRAFIKELQKHKAAGNAAFQAGKREVAIEHYSAALACNSSSRPFNAVCLANRAAAYQALGSFAEAIADCSRAVVLDPEYAKALSRRATLHELIRDHSESVRDLERLSEILTSRQKASHRDPALTQEIRGVAERKKKAQEAVQKDVPVDHYKVLGVEKEGGEAEIKKAYRKAALRHHPDKAVQFLSMLKEEEKAAVTEEIHSEAERLFKIIGEAYNVLSNSSKRMAYDADEEDRTFRSSVRNFGRSSRSHGFSRSHGGRGSGASSWSNVRRPFDSEWAEDFFGRKGRGASKSRDDDNSDYYWDADFY